MRKKLRLQQHQCPGDVIVMTMAIESLHKTYPDEYITGVNTFHDELFLHHPLIEEVKEEEGQDIKMNYDLIHECHIPIHFGAAYCHTLSEAIGRPLRLRTHRPSLYVTSEELKHPQVAGRYCLINAGYKDDYKTKWAGTELYQSVVDAHKKNIMFVQVGSDNDTHPRLNGAVDLVGKTSLRQLMRLCFGCQFGIGGVTALGHMCAAFEKPYVALMGGREPVNWEAYPTQISLTTQNLLNCCRGRACWKSHFEDKDTTKNCVLPVITNNNDKIPTCMNILKSSAIASVACLLLQQ
jgi:hypothetical protein